MEKYTFRIQWPKLPDWQGPQAVDESKVYRGAPALAGTPLPEYIRAQVNDHITVLSLVVQLAAISNRSADDIIAEANERTQTSAAGIVEVLKWMIRDAERKRKIGP